MSDAIIAKLTEKLNEEKWTRAALNSYTISNFQELDELLDEIKDNKLLTEAKEICDEHLDHAKNSIIALYLSGVIALSKQLIDDAHLVQIINIFSDNHKWSIVEYLCSRILDFGENKFALRTLAECYSNENKDQEKLEIWERLIRIDYNEAEIVKKIAVIKEDAGEVDTAVKYYKKALHRFISKKMFSQVREIWIKLVEYIEEDFEFFFLISKKIGKNLSTEKSAILLKDLYPVVKEKENWDTCLSLLKTLLEIESRDQWARDEIIECYKNKYESHSHLEEYVRLSNLNQNWRNALEAISDFEKHISFDKGNFVYHKTWNVGIIKDIQSGEVTIDFAKKRDHTMSLKMAINALNSLEKDHIWVLKSVAPKEKLKAKIKGDVEWALKTIIKSFDNRADMKRIKAELNPSILTTSEWSTWSTEARKVLKTNPVFGNMPDKVDTFMVRDKPISFEEKSFNKFKAENSFFNKVQTIEEFLENSDPDTDYFMEMFQYFVGFLKAPASNVQTICSYLLIEKLVAAYPFLNPGISIDIKDYLSEIPEMEKIFIEIGTAELKKDFLTAIKRNYEDWPEIYINLFPYYLNKSILEDLISNGNKDLVHSKLSEIVDHYRDNREVFFWIAKFSSEIPHFDKVDVKYEKILINLVHLLEITYRDISNKKDVAPNRKLNRNIQSYLFKENHLLDFIEQQEEDTTIRIFTLLQDVRDLDPVLLMNIKQSILKIFPEISLPGTEEKPEIVASSKNFYVTQQGYSSKQKELKYILEVEIPKNSKEIGKAIEMGDLKENAEYKAGKEKQETLNITVGKLKDELDRARIIQGEDIDTKKIGFGIKTELMNLNNNKKEVFTILGPWESDPSNNIISYLSPFGAEIAGNTVGDKVDFEINETKYSYEVLKIEKAL